MHAFSRSLARAVKNARDKMNLTQEQVGELVDTNTRTISSIENGKSNTRMNILYPLVRVLRIDPNEIFYPETVADSSVKHQLRALIENCSDEEAAALLTTSESVLRVLRKQNAGKIEEKKEPVSPWIRGSRLCVLSSGSLAHYNFQLYNINFDFLFALWTVEREFYQYCLFAHLGSRFTSANRAINP